jgi:Photoprotection regulator fluorescence recovery protein
MSINDEEWSKQEKQIARSAFDLAYARETAALIKLVTDKSSVVTQIDEVWVLHDFLSAKRHDIDGKYDYRYSVLIIVFSRLVNEGWLSLNDLEGLATDKLAKVAALARMALVQ